MEFLLGLSDSAAVMLHPALEQPISAADLSSLARLGRRQLPHRRTGL
jgi:hypothetical protein